jgi:glycosyltransferase involved in cell wall biosynthesis
MRILLIAYYYPPQNASGGQRPLKLAEHLAAAGHDVVVLTSALDRRPVSRKNIIPVHDPSHNQDRTGRRRFQWLALRLMVEAKNRAGIYASLFSGWARAARRREEAIMAAGLPQAIIATYPPVETVKIGLHFSRKFKAPLIADFRDGLLFEPVERRALRLRSVRRSYEKLEARVAREAAAIVTVSPAISDYFQKKYAGSRVVTILNGYDVGAPVLPLIPSPFAPGRFHVVHTGSIALSDRGCDLAHLVLGVKKALAAVPALRARLVIHFAGRLNARERRLLRPLAAAGIVRLYGQLPRENALWMQQNADLLLLLASPDRTSVATGKLFEYMQAARPVLALAAGTLAADIVAETGIGWTVPPDDPQAISAMLAAIMTQKIARPEINEQAIANYDRKRQYKKFLALLKQICE